MNPLLGIDFYKLEHHRQYPPGTTEVYSNFTPRTTRLPFPDGVIFFGMQYVAWKYLIEQWDEHFFNQDIGEVIGYFREVTGYTGDLSHFVKLHDLGYLPIQIKALKEGTLVPIGIPVMTIKNTLPEFFWLTNFLETAISSMLWKPCTSATQAFHYAFILRQMCETTGCEFNPYQAHDFSFRGMSGIEDAALSGAGHLTCFKGTDTVPALALLKEYYNLDGAEYGAYVPATEHSVMCAEGREGEIEILVRLLIVAYPTGIISIVADSYNLWGFICIYLDALRSTILNRPGKVVIRPDSGDPHKIICGDPDSIQTAPKKGVLQLLWDIFGGTVNEQGYKVLNPKIGLIYGDAITVKTMKNILITMSAQGFAASNVIFGIGSYTYQYVTRDTLGFAMKATSIVTNGQRHAIQKDPITASGKRSAKGLLLVHAENDGRLGLEENVTELEEGYGLLKTVFMDGTAYCTDDIESIRKRVRENLSLLLE